MLATGSVYQSRDQEQLPLAERSLFVGIAVAFTCTIQIPEAGVPLADDPAQGHRFSLLAKPALSFSAGTTDWTPEQNATAVYGVMAATAFDDFKQALIESYGLDAPKPEEKQ